MYGDEQVVLTVAVHEGQLHKWAVCEVDAAFYLVGDGCNILSVVVVDRQLLHGVHVSLAVFAHEECSVSDDGSEHVVMLGDGSQGCIQGILVEAALYLKHYGLIIVVGGR